nr:MAG TPA: hypothetical protein [Caudoviricetes sp.]
MMKKLVGGGTKSSIKSSACISSKQILRGEGLLFSNSPRKESRCHLLDREHRDDY